ncbi:virilizer-like isoform X2 [Solea senegalensis]|uniref:Virilizer-like isoform X2 n=1 Tax=Solea senegalensis TaxID=28829 RepID=A0AAV6PPV5_SOLSE|nr:protein virilizer homolog isoform X1 [Solea senegalensis]KAG7474716.1 virilizer-like isoform X2 [Solea senegalensis]
MAGDLSTELLFLDTFKHQSAELTNVDVVRFPCGVLITEVRVIPPGIKAHSNLPDSRAFGETSPHAFQLELFFNNLTKSNSPTFHRLGSLEYDENKSIVFRPNGKVNTDGLVLRGWYTSLTVAVYGTAERSHGHGQDSPPPPPPPPPQQPSGPKRIVKQEWEKDDQYNGSPPRPAPRGPRTPPGPPPPDDDDEEQVQVTVGVVKDEPGEGRDDYLEAVSPERSLPADEPYSDAEQEEEGDEEEEEEQEEEEDARTEGSAPEEEEEEEEEEDEGEDEEEEMEEGDDGYEQISSDEDDLDNGSFKLPTFDMDYTPEDLASVPPVQFDPYERELRPLLYFTPPYKTRFDIQLEKSSVEEPRDAGDTKELPGGEEAEAVAQVKELLASVGEERDARWVTALEEVPGLLAKGLAYLIKQGEGEEEDLVRVLVKWTLQALSMEIALTQPIALNLRQLKAGAKLASYLADCPQGLTVLLCEGALGVLLELLHTNHVSSTLKLSILRALDALISTPAGVEAFLHTGESEKSGYQHLVQLFLREETVRVITAGNAIIQKSHMYEVLVDLQHTASAWSETQQEDIEDAENAMEEEPSLNSPPVSEAELDRLTGVLEELHHLLETASHCMVQPPGKAFPTTARITGPQERDDPYPALYRYMHTCHFLESTTVVLSAAAAAGHVGVTQAVRELLRFLSLTQPGLLFLVAQPAPTNLLLRLLASMAEAEGEESAFTGGEGTLTGPGFGEEGFAVWLMQALHALQGVSELMSHVAAGGEGGAGLEEGDNAEVLGMLHALYLMTFTQTGRSAVSHVFSLDNNLSCLVTLLQHHSKDGQSEAKARKAVTYNYACMLVLLVVQSSLDLRMMEQFASPLLSLAKADETNAKLQELNKWLEPLEKLRFEIGSIPTLLDYIKRNVENVLTADGTGLVTALRCLCHIGCPPPAVEGQQKDLKWSLAGVQLFSGEGLDTCVHVLQKLCSILLQPWRVHGHMGPTPQRCMILSICISTLRLLRTMLTELLRGGAFQFRDTRVASVLVTLHMIVCSIPASGRLDGEETRVQAFIVDVLLTFTQGVSEQVTHTEETLASNTWSLMLKEVLNSLLKAPEGLFSGLTLLSELLPLPLPMQSTQVISVQDVAVALNTRKLWSMHIRAQWKVFSEALKCVCATTCPPLLAMLRRVCVQLADLSSLTATLTMKTLVELLLEELQPVEGKNVCWAQTLRLLSLMDTLVSQRACKSAALHLLSGSVSGDEQLAELFPLLLSLLIPPTDHCSQQQQCSELVGTIFQSLCDQDISLVVSPPSESCVSEAEQLANALPGRDMMSSVCNSLLEVLGNDESSVPLLLTCIRTLTFLSEHDYGLYHVKFALKKHGTGLCALLKRLVLSFNKDSADLLSALLDFLRQILNTDAMSVEEGLRSGEESSFSTAPRLWLSGFEMKALLHWEESESHPLQTLEKEITKLCKEDESLEAILENVIVLRQTLETATDTPPAAETEPTLPPAETLGAQFNHRTVFILSEALDEHLKALWFSPFQTDDIETDLDVVKVDLVGLAQECCPELDLKAELERSFLSEPSSPGHTKATKGFRLGKHKHETFITSSGKSDYIEPAKRAHIMAAPRGRGGRGGFGQNLCRPHDIFRQRKQNTSRPPSMHVDDFVAAEFKDITTPLGLLPPKRLPKSSPKPPTRGLFTGNRGRATFHSQTRFFTPPQPKGVLLSGNYARRDGGRGGSSWSGQVPAVTHRGTYSEPRGGQSNFTRGPLPSRQPPASAYRLAPRDRAPRGRGGTGLSWPSGGAGGGGAGGGGGGGGRGSQGSKFSGGGGSGGGRGRHVRSFTR